MIILKELDSFSSNKKALVETGAIVPIEFYIKNEGSFFYAIVEMSYINLGL